MVKLASQEKNTWERTKTFFTKGDVVLGPSISHRFLDDPTFVIPLLTRYKLAAKLGAVGRSVLEIGCGEGLGTTLLGELAASYTGFDENSLMLAEAKRLFPHEKYLFIEALECDPVDTIIDFSEHAVFPFHLLKPSGLILVSKEKRHLSSHFNNIFEFETLLLMCNLKCL